MRRRRSLSCLPGRATMSAQSPPLPFLPLSHAAVSVSPEPRCWRMCHRSCRRRRCLEPLPETCREPSAHLLKNSVSHFSRSTVGMTRPSAALFSASR